MNCTNCGEPIGNIVGSWRHLDSGMELCHVEDHVVYEEQLTPHDDDPDVIVATQVAVAVERTKAQPPPSDE